MGNSTFRVGVDHKRRLQMIADAIRPGALFPQAVAVPFGTILQWARDSDWLFEEELKGVRALLWGEFLEGRHRCYSLPGLLPLELAGYVFDGQLTGSFYWPFDVLITPDQDLCQAPLEKRRAVLRGLLLPKWMILAPSSFGYGGEFVKWVMTHGGKGVFAKRLSARYGIEWYMAER